MNFSHTQISHIICRKFHFEIMFPMSQSISHILWIFKYFCFIDWLLWDINLDDFLYCQTKESLYDLYTHLFLKETEDTVKYYNKTEHFLCATDSRRVTANSLSINFIKNSRLNVLINAYLNSQNMIEFIVKWKDAEVRLVILVCHLYTWILQNNTKLKSLWQNHSHKHTKNLGMDVSHGKVI